MKQRTFKLDTERAKELASDYIKGLPLKPKMAVTVETYAQRRNKEQNARHWARMEQLAYWMCKKHNKCHDKEVWHYYFAGECFGWVDVGIGGRAVPAPTKDRSKFEFSEFEAFIDGKADEWGVTLLEREEWQEYKQAAGL